MRRKDDEILKKEIANRIRTIRNDLGMTQEQFSETLEISISAYKKVESGENQLSIECMRKLNRKLKVSSDYLLFGNRTSGEEAWKAMMNCSETDKIMIFLRLIKYFTRDDTCHYVTEDMQHMWDERIYKIIKEMKG